MLLERIDHSLDVLAVNLDCIQEIQYLIERGVRKHKHVLGQGLNEAQHATLCVEPSVSAKLLLEWLEALRDAGDSKSVVALSAVEGTDDEVDDAQVVDLSCRLLNGDTLLLLLKALHQLLGVRVLACHDVAHAEIRKDDGRDTQEVIHLSAHEWLIVANGVAVLVLLHEEDVSDVKLPGLVLAAELSALTEDLLNHRVVLQVPVGLGLHHKHWDVLVKGCIVLLECGVDRLGVAGNARILDGLSLLAQGVDVLVSQVFKLLVSFILVCLVEDEILKEVEVLL